VLRVPASVKLLPRKEAGTMFRTYAVIATLCLLFAAVPSAAGDYIPEPPTMQELEALQNSMAWEPTATVAKQNGFYVKKAKVAGAKGKKIRTRLQIYNGFVVGYDINATLSCSKTGTQIPIALQLTFAVGAEPALDRAFVRDPRGTNNGNIDDAGQHIFALVIGEVKGNKVAMQTWLRTYPPEEPDWDAETEKCSAFVEETLSFKKKAKFNSDGVVKVYDLTQDAGGAKASVLQTGFESPPAPSKCSKCSLSATRDPESGEIPILGLLRHSVLAEAPEEFRVCVRLYDGQVKVASVCSGTTFGPTETGNPVETELVTECVGGANLTRAEYYIKQANLPRELLFTKEITLDYSCAGI